MDIINIKNYHQVYRSLKDKRDARRNSGAIPSVQQLNKFKENYDDIFRKSKPMEEKK